MFGGDNRIPFCTLYDKLRVASEPKTSSIHLSISTVMHSEMFKTCLSFRKTFLSSKDDFNVFKISLR